MCSKDIFGTNLKEVVIGNSVTSIRDWAFSGCSGLTSVIIGNSVTSIRDWAFSGCSGLTSVIIGNSVKNIGNRAFYGADNLSKIYTLAIFPPFCASDNVFSETVYKTATVYVPDTNNALTRYLGADVWKKFYNVEEFDVTGIATPTVDITPVSSTYHNLQGQRITGTKRGLYINNGKKVLVR